MGGHNALANVECTSASERLRRARRALVNVNALLWHRSGVAASTVAACSIQQ